MATLLPKGGRLGNRGFGGIAADFQSRGRPVGMGGAMDEAGAGVDVRRLKADFRDEMRQGLLAAAARILAEEGLGALTVRRLAARVNASTKLVYTLFGGKDGVLEALYLDAFDGLAAELAVPVPGGDPLADLRAMAHAYRHYALAHPDRYAVMFGDAGAAFNPSPQARRHAWATFKAMRDALARALGARDGAGVENGGNADTLARTLWAGMHGVVSLELRRILGGEGTAEQVYEGMLSIILDPLAAADKETIRLQ